MRIEETPWKCFLMDMDSNSVYGVMSESDNRILFQWLGNAGRYKFYSMSTHSESKEWLKARNLVSTLNYYEAFNHSDPQLYR
jgi:hypothetical protein